MLRETPNNRVKWMLWFKPTQRASASSAEAQRVDGYTRVIEYPLEEICSASRLPAEDVLRHCVDAVKAAARSPDWLIGASRGVEIGDILYIAGRVYMYAKRGDSREFVLLDTPDFVREFESYHFGGT